MNYIPELVAKSAAKVYIWVIDKDGDLIADMEIDEPQVELLRTEGSPGRKVHITATLEVT